MSDSDSISSETARNIRTFQKAIARAFANPAIAGAQQTIRAQKNAIAIAKAFANPAIAEAQRNYQAYQNAITKAFAANEIAVPINAAILEDPSSIQEMVDIVSNIDNEKITAIPDSIDESIEKLSKAKTKTSFLQAFTNLPPVIQALVLFIIVELITPIFPNIIADRLKPIVSQYLVDNTAPDRKKISDIKQLPLSLEGIDTNGLRFITGNNVRLRTEPSTNSQILDELTLGQVVTVVSKKRNWIEVMYTYKDGELLSGWVFTRYTAKFKELKHHRK